MVGPIRAENQVEHTQCTSVLPEEKLQFLSESAKQVGYLHWIGYFLSFPVFTLPQ